MTRDDIRPQTRPVITYAILPKMRVLNPVLTQSWGICVWASLASRTAEACARKIRPMPPVSNLFNDLTARRTRRLPFTPGIDII